MCGRWGGVTCRDDIVGLIHEAHQERERCKDLGERGEVEGEGWYVV